MEGQPVFLITILTALAMLQLNPNGSKHSIDWSKYIFEQSLCTGVDLNVGCVPADLFVMPE